MKRSLVAAASAIASEQPAKLRKVKHETYQKWVKEYDRECQTVTWLDCDAGIEGGVKLVTKLKCRVCTKFRDRTVGRKNFSGKWSGLGTNYQRSRPREVRPACSRNEPPQERTSPNTRC